MRQLQSWQALAYPLICLAAGLQFAFGAALLPLAQDVELLAGMKQLEGVGGRCLSIVWPSSMPATWRCRPLFASFAHCAGAGYSDIMQYFEPATATVPNDISASAEVSALQSCQSEGPMVHTLRRTCPAANLHDRLRNP
jgi:hypothetical protein